MECPEGGVWGRGDWLMFLWLRWREGGACLCLRWKVMNRSRSWRSGVYLSMSGEGYNCKKEDQYNIHKVPSIQEINSHKINI